MAKLAHEAALSNTRANGTSIEGNSLEALDIDHTSGDQYTLCKLTTLGKPQAKCYFQPSCRAMRVIHPRYREIAF